MTATHQVECFHESAHAIAYFSFGHPVELVEAGPDTGRCVPASEWEQTFNEKQLRDLVHRETLLQWAIVSCAGKSAMDRWYGYRAKSDENWYASDDHRRGFKYALELA